MYRSDIIVIGAGIAGASAAAELASAGRSVTLLEAESQPGHHTIEKPHHKRPHLALPERGELNPG